MPFALAKGLETTKLFPAQGEGSFSVHFSFIKTKLDARMMVTSRSVSAAEELGSTDGFSVTVDVGTDKDFTAFAITDVNASRPELPPANPVTDGGLQGPFPIDQLTGKGTAVLRNTDLVAAKEYNFSVFKRSEYDGLKRNPHVGPLNLLVFRRISTPSQLFSARPEEDTTIFPNKVTIGFTDNNRLSEQDFAACSYRLSAISYRLFPNKEIRGLDVMPWGPKATISSMHRRFDDQDDSILVQNSQNGNNKGEFLLEGMQLGQFWYDITLTATTTCKRKNCEPRTNVQTIMWRYGPPVQLNRNLFLKTIYPAVSEFTKSNLEKAYYYDMEPSNIQMTAQTPLPPNIGKPWVNSVHASITRPDEPDLPRRLFADTRHDYPNGSNGSVFLIGAATKKKSRLEVDWWWSMGRHVTPNFQFPKVMIESPAPPVTKVVSQQGSVGRMDYFWVYSMPDKRTVELQWGAYWNNNFINTIEQISDASVYFTIACRHYVNDIEYSGKDLTDPLSNYRYYDMEVYPAVSGPVGARKGRDLWFTVPLSNVNLTTSNNLYEVTIMMHTNTARHTDGICHDKKTVVIEKRPGKPVLSGVEGDAKPTTKVDSYYSDDGFDGSVIFPWGVPA
jgi:hypothetical protein